MTGDPRIQERSANQVAGCVCVRGLAGEAVYRRTSLSKRSNRARTASPHPSRNELLTARAATQAGSGWCSITSISIQSSA